MSRSITIPVLAATALDLPSIKLLLASASLPVADLDAAPGVRFWVARDADHIVGAVGLQPFGSNGLLRSLVVAPSHRDRGLGSSLVTTLEDEVSSQSVKALVLLTQTAEPFFLARGYTAIDRVNVPDQIKLSAEFHSLCPASAVCMTKSLENLRSQATGA